MSEKFLWFVQLKLNFITFHLVWQINRTERTGRQHFDSVLWITQAFDASSVLGEPKLSNQFNGAEKSGDYFWAIGCAQWQWNTRSGSQRHEASVSHRWSTRFTCKSIYSKILWIFRNLKWFWTYFCLLFQYEYFFENAETPKVCEQPEPAQESTPKSQTNLLLDNVAKIECKYFLEFCNEKWELPKLKLPLNCHQTTSSVHWSNGEDTLRIQIRSSGSK